MNPRPPLPTSALDLAAIFFRHQRTAWLIVLTTMVCSIFWMFVLRENQYEVTAKLLVRIGREQSAPTTMMDQKATFIGDRGQDVNSEVEILQNRELMGRVVDRLGLDRSTQESPPRNPFAWLRFQVKHLVRGFRDTVDEALIRVGFRERLSAREKAIFMLDQALHVGRQRDSNVILAGLLLPVKHGSGAVLNALLEEYQLFRLEVFQDRSAVNFFQGRVSDSQRRLGASELELRRFERVGGIRSVEDQKRTLVEQLARAQRDFEAADAARKQARSRVERWERELKRSEPDFSAVGSFREGSYPEQLMGDLTRLQKEREQLRLVELEDGKRMRNNRQQFQLLLNLLHSTLRTDLTEKQEAAEAGLSSQRRIQAQLDSLQAGQLKWNELRRSSANLEESNLFYRRKLEEASASSALTQDRIGNVSILEHASDPVKPSGMRKTTLLGMCLMFGILAALASISLLEFFDHRVHEGETLAWRLQTPLLGAIPAEGTLQADGRVDERGIAEAWGRAALALAANHTGPGAAVVALTCAAAGPASGVATLRLARELRRTLGRRVLAVQACPAAPGTRPWGPDDPAHTLEARPESGPLGAVQAIEAGVDAVGYGQGSEDPAVRLQSLRELLAQASGVYDHILVDAGSALVGAEALGVCGQVARVSLVAEAGRTRLEVLARIRAELGSHGARLEGALLIGQQRVVPGWCYRLLAG